MSVVSHDIKADTPLDLTLADQPAETPRFELVELKQDLGLAVVTSDRRFPIDRVLARLTAGPSINPYGYQSVCQWRAEIFGLTTDQRYGPHQVGCLTEKTFSSRKLAISWVVDQITLQHAHAVWSAVRKAPTGLTHIRQIGPEKLRRSIEQVVSND
ncbi:MAG: hypothetical protein Alpg2KO_01210 [Alphaproteobacteria bacterium]